MTEFLKLPVWVEDQHGTEYQIEINELGVPVIRLPKWGQLMAAHKVIDQPEGHTFTWGMWGFTEYTFIVTRNDRYQGNKDIY